MRLTPPQQHEAGAHRHDHSGHPGIDAKGGIQRPGNAVGLHHVANAKAGQTAENGKGSAQPAPVATQTILDRIHRPTNLFAAVIGLAEMHRQQHLGVLGGHADQRGHPHPEHGPRTTNGDGGCHAGNIAGAYGSGQRRHQCGIGRDLARCVRCRLAATPDHDKTGHDPGDRHEPQAQLQEQAGSQNGHQHWRPPHNVVDRGDDLRQCFHDPVSPMDAQAARRATNSISTSTSRGRRATCTVERAGVWLPKRRAYTAFRRAKSFRSCTNTVLLTT